MSGTDPDQTCALDDHLLDAVFAFLMIEYMARHGRFTYGLITPPRAFVRSVELEQRNYGVAFRDEFDEILIGGAGGSHSIHEMTHASPKG